MVEPTNFLAQNQEFAARTSKATVDPAAAAMNFMKMKYMASQMQGAEMDEEVKMLAMTKGYIERLTGPEDLDRMKAHFEKKYPDSPIAKSIPSSSAFGPDKPYKSFQDWQLEVTTTAAERLKAKKGEEFEIWTRDENGLTTKNKNMTNEKLIGLQKLGVLKQYGKDWGFGEVTHQPDKTEEQKAKEAGAVETAKLDAQKKAGTLETTKEKEERQVRVAQAGMKPDKFVDEDGDVRYLRPGAEVPKGWKPYEKPTEEKDKLTVYATQAEAIQAGRPYQPKGKVTVPKPAKGGFTYDYETPSTGDERQERSDKILGTNLRKEFNNLQPVKDYRNIKTKMGSIETVYEESKSSKNFVAIDQALISLFNKMTDPQSVVRESEYARTGQNMPVINSVIGKMEKWLKGGAGLTGEEREAIVKVAKSLNKTYEKNFNALKKEYRGYAKDYGLNPDNVIKEDDEEKSDPLGLRK